MDLSHKESFYKSKSTRVLILLGFYVDRSDRSDPPVRPVGDARPATWSRPIRPLIDTGQTGLFGLCQFWSLTVGGVAMQSIIYSSGAGVGGNSTDAVKKLHAYDVDASTLEVCVCLTACSLAILDSPGLHQ